MKHHSDASHLIVALLVGIGVILFHILGKLNELMEIFARLVITSP